jgi:hypothetical protein
MIRGTYFIPQGWMIGGERLEDRSRCFINLGGRIWLNLCQCKRYPHMFYIFFFCVLSLVLCHQAAFGCALPKPSFTSLSEVRHNMHGHLVFKTRRTVTALLKTHVCQTYPHVACYAWHWTIVSVSSWLDGFRWMTNT